jgi:outer membrane lipoprotein-sorting protein
MKRRYLLLSLCAAAPLSCLAQSADLGKVLSQMDAASARFHSASADFKADIFTAVVQQHDSQQGSTEFKRTGAATEMEVHVTGGQGANTQVVFRNHQLYYYTPETRQETIYSAGKNGASYESFLTIGFGGSGKDLQSAWDVTYQGMETIDGTKVAKLDLVPKQEQVKSNFSHITLWIDPTRSLAYKQEFFQPDGDTRTVTYSNVRYNVPIPESAFNIKVAPGTQVIQK